MDISYLDTNKAPAAFGPFSQGTSAGNFVFTSGAMPLNPETGELVSGDIAAQTRRTLENLKAVLEAGGSSLDRVVSVTVYITDMNEFQQMNEVYARFFGEECPARATVGVTFLAKNARVEMQAVALRRS